MESDELGFAESVADNLDAIERDALRMASRARVAATMLKRLIEEKRNPSLLRASGRALSDSPAIADATATPRAVRS